MNVRKLAPKSLRTTSRRAAVWWGERTADRRPAPDFLVIGGQRCGTTSLFRALLAHPQIRRAQLHKGVNYFDLDYARGESWYRGHFPARSTADDLRVFDASGYYMFHPQAPGRIVRDLPGVRLIAMVRDPVERAYSAFKHELARGYEWEHSFARAIELEDARLEGEVERMMADPSYQSFNHRHHAYRRRGEYARLLDYRAKMENAADTAVLAEDHILFLLRELLKGAGAAQRIPDHPGQLGVNDAAAGTTDQGFVEIGFVADGIGAAQHRVFGFGGQFIEGGQVEKVAHLAKKIGGILAVGDERHPLGVIDIGIERTLHLGGFQRADESLNVGAAAKGHELHVEPLIERDHLAIFPPLLADIDILKGIGRLLCRSTVGNVESIGSCHCCFPLFSSIDQVNASGQ